MNRIKLLTELDYYLELINHLIFLIINQKYIILIMDLFHEINSLK